MTKAEVIKKAYGAFFEKCKPDENGWTQWRVIAHGESNGLHPEDDLGLEDDFFQIKDNYGDGRFKWRPKVLAGIENNNGWIKIDSVNDLPTHYCSCRVMLKQKLITNTKAVMCYDPDTHFFENDMARIKFKAVSHYYEMFTEEKDPIY